MKVVIIQKDTNNGDYLQFFEDIAELQPELVLLGELGATGCLYNGGKGLTTEKLQNELEKFPFVIGIGYPCSENGRLFNRYALFNSDKFYAYDKINLFEPMNETKVYKAGETPGYMETPLGKLGVAICYDIRFPDLFDQLKEAGSEMVIIPAAFPRVRIQAWRSLLIERAIQTGLTVIGINAVGDDGTNEFGGSSMVVGPDGQIIAQADEINESIIEVEL